MGNIGLSCSTSTQYEQKQLVCSQPRDRKRRAETTDAERRRRWRSTRTLRPLEARDNFLWLPSCRTPPAKERRLSLSLKKGQATGIDYMPICRSRVSELCMPYKRICYVYIQFGHVLTMLYIPIFSQTVLYFPLEWANPKKH